MINYVEKGMGLHHAISEAGHALWEIDGEWKADNPEAVQAIIDSYTPGAFELDAINAACEECLKALCKEYPPMEMSSWAKQEKEAREGGGLFTQSLANERGIPLSLLCEKIISKADSFATVSGRLIGLRQQLERRILDGELNVVWPEVL